MHFSFSPESSLAGNDARFRQLQPCSLRQRLRTCAGRKFRIRWQKVLSGVSPEPAGCALALGGEELHPLQVTQVLDPTEVLPRLRTTDQRGQGANRLSPSPSICCSTPAPGALPPARQRVMSTLRQARRAKVSA